MLLPAFAYFFFMTSLVLGVYALIAYMWPDSISGRVAAILRG